jgi:AhpD family alkylhydroperoxidase
MKQRLNWAAKQTDGLAGLTQAEEWVKRTLDHTLLHLVKMRASQINGCAFCLHMHSAEARKDGERDERLFLLDAWQESGMYTDRERAALAWTESLTHVSETHAPDDVYEEVRRHFNEDELVALTMAIGLINAWNRMAIGFRAQHPNERKLAAATAA